MIKRGFYFSSVYILYRFVRFEFISFFCRF